MALGDSLARFYKLENIFCHSEMIQLTSKNEPLLCFAGGADLSSHEAVLPDRRQRRKQDLLQTQRRFEISSIVSNRQPCHANQIERTDIENLAFIVNLAYLVNLANLVSLAKPVYVVFVN